MFPSISSIFYEEKKGSLNLQINSFNVHAELDELVLPFLFYVENHTLLHTHAFLSPSQPQHWPGTGVGPHGSSFGRPACHQRAYES